MTHVHDCGHAEQAEHLSVGIHDSWNVVQQVNSQKHRRKTPGAFLNRGCPWHRSEHYISGDVVVYSQFMGPASWIFGTPRPEAAGRSILVIAAFFITATATVLGAEPGRATYDALFASFLPLAEVQQKPELSQMFLKAREQVWIGASTAPAFRALITPFSDLRSFGDACGLSGFLKTAGNATAFEQLTAAQRTHALFLLHT